MYTKKKDVHFCIILAVAKTKKNYLKFMVNKEIAKNFNNYQKQKQKNINIG